ncbi:hypothetical protein SCHPADRAFT_945521 [Schizopora paradoxa]|uniref:Uncharacterized protein n=1 Tax=Schizopora paradoxa TaxID=27342 RepID=A0A0H2RQP4_9AGAM|nr:hypothetical protein SCHPADRAFT_945521 [Schizopora paradoxa]
MVKWTNNAIRRILEGREAQYREASGAEAKRDKILEFIGEVSEELDEESSFTQQELVQKITVWYGNNIKIRTKGMAKPPKDQGKTKWTFRRVVAEYYKRRVTKMQQALRERKARAKKEGKKGGKGGGSGDKGEAAEGEDAEGDKSEEGEGEGEKSDEETPAKDPEDEAIQDILKGNKVDNISFYQEAVSKVISWVILDDERIQLVDELVDRWNQVPPPIIQSRNASKHLLKRARKFRDETERDFGAKMTCWITWKTADGDYVKTLVESGEGTPNAFSKVFDGYKNESLYVEFGEHYTKILKAEERKRKGIPDDDEDEEEQAPQKGDQARQAALAKLLAQVELDEKGHVLSLPALKRLSLPQLKDLVRAIFTKQYQIFTGNPHVQVPWKAVSKNPLAFLKEGFFPTNTPLEDPCRMNQPFLKPLYQEWEALVKKKAFKMMWKQAQEKDCKKSRRKMKLTGETKIKKMTVEEQEEYDLDSETDEDEQLARPAPPRVQPPRRASSSHKSKSQEPDDKSEDDDNDEPEKREKEDDPDADEEDEEVQPMRDDDEDRALLESSDEEQLAKQAPMKRKQRTNTATARAPTTKAPPPRKEVDPERRAELRPKPARSKEEVRKSMAAMNESASSGSDFEDERVAKKQRVEKGKGRAEPPTVQQEPIPESVEQVSPDQFLKDMRCLHVEYAKLVDLFFNLSYSDQNLLSNKAEFHAPSWLYRNQQCKYLPEDAIATEGWGGFLEWLEECPFLGKKFKIMRRNLHLAILGLGLLIRDTQRSLFVEPDQLPSDLPPYIQFLDAGTEHLDHLGELCVQVQQAIHVHLEDAALHKAKMLKEALGLQGPSGSTAVDSPEQTADNAPLAPAQKEDEREHDEPVTPTPNSGRLSPALPRAPSPPIQSSVIPPVRSPAPQDRATTPPPQRLPSPATPRTPQPPPRTPSPPPPPTRSKENTPEVEGPSGKKGKGRKRDRKQDAKPEPSAEHSGGEEGSSRPKRNRIITEKGAELAKGKEKSNKLQGKGKAKPQEVKATRTSPRRKELPERNLRSRANR